MLFDTSKSQIETTIPPPGAPSNLKRLVSDVADQLTDINLVS